MNNFYKWLNEQEEEESLDYPDRPMTEPMEGAEVQATKKDKDLMRAMMGYLVVANNYPNVNEKAIENRKKIAENILHMNLNTFTKAENRLLKLGMIDYELDITNEGKTFLQKYKVKDAKPEEINKFLRLSGDEWIMEMWESLQNLKDE